MRNDLKLEDLFEPEDLKGFITEMDLMYSIEPLLSRLLEDFLGRREKRKKERRRLKKRKSTNRKSK
jgi:hypothetical protein